MSSFARLSFQRKKRSRYDKMATTMKSVILRCMHAVYGMPGYQRWYMCGVVVYEGIHRFFLT